VATRVKTIVALAQIDNLEHKLSSAKNPLNLGVIFFINFVDLLLTMDSLMTFC
jgi:hypothetical protein